MTCPNHASFPPLTVARRGSCGPTRKLIGLAPHPVVGLVLQTGDAEKFPQALGFECLVLFFFFFQSQPAGSLFQAQRRMEVTKRLVVLELSRKADGVAQTVKSGHYSHCPVCNIHYMPQGPTCRKIVVHHALCVTVPRSHSREISTHRVRVRLSAASLH